MDAWRPTGRGDAWQLSEILSPLAPIKHKINVIDGIRNDVNYLNQESNGHNAAARTLLTCQPFAANIDGNGNLVSRGRQVENGFANGPSLDQVIAQRLNAGTRFDTLDLGIGGRFVGEAQILHAGPNDPVAINGDPRDVFERLFSNIPAPGSGGQGVPPSSTNVSTLDRIRARRGSVLDTVLDGFGRIHARLGAADRARLEAHADKIRTLEAQFPNTPVDAPPPPPPSQDCEQPTLPTFPGRYDSNSPFFDDISARAMIDEMLMALVCDLTRVGTLQFTQYQGPTFPWLDVNVPGSYTNWHAMIHEAVNAPSRTELIRVMRWYAEMFAYLIQQMDSIQEGDRTMLDNSLVLWVSDFSNGAAHDTYELPFVSAGSLGGIVRTDRYLRGNDRSHGDFYTAILNAFGYPDRSFGWPEFSTGPWSEFIA